MNLTWWRKRPSVHVAECEDARVIDMNDAIWLIDPDTSPFTSLLAKMENPGYTTITVKSPLPPQFAVGAFIDHDGHIHRIESVTKKGSDDWFAPEEFVLGIRKPWVEKRPVSPKISWLEDDFMPRLRSKPLNTHAILTNITDTYAA